MGFGYHVYFIGVLLSGVLFTVPAKAESPEEQAPPESSVWGKTREFAGDLWQKTQQAADETWENARGYLGGSPADDSFPRVWEDIVPRLEETRQLEDQQRELPEQAWFARDRDDNIEDINALLDESIEILAVSSSNRYRSRIRELEQSIREAQDKIAEYRRRRVAAPKEALLEKTVEDYGQAIAEQSAQIAAYRSQLQGVKNELARELRAQGLEISGEQLDFLLSTVVGDDLLTLGVAFDNVRSITSQLEQLMVESQEDLNSARRYYGMYTVLLKVLVRMHQQVIDGVNQRYLAEIDAIIAATKGLLEETRRLQRRSPGNHQALAANIEAQRLTLQTATFYRDYLVEQARDVIGARDSLIEDMAIAENTYETVKVSGELVDLMKSSQHLLEALMDRQVPPLRTFENVAMKREFEKLTAQLREGVK
jgi:hypothetical protein